MRGKKRWCGVALLVLLVGGGLAWFERASLRAWWVLRGLRQADEADRAAWIDRVADLGEPAFEGLLDCLCSGDDRACRNAVAALDHLSHTWGPGDPRTADLAGRQARAYSRLCPRGQALLLEAMTGWVSDQPPSPGVVSACSRMLAETAGSSDAHTIAAGLELAARLLRQPRTTEALRSARELARTALRSESPDNRLQAIRLSLLPGVDLLDQVVALLHDPAVAVRRGAILAVGPADQVIRDEGLLPCLHDPDPEVRRLTEAALRGRGLRPEHIRLGRLLTHPSARARLEVLDHLDRDDLDPGLWLRRLSHDSSPAVRAAALRVMSQQTLLDLSDRIDQMARSDPSPSVAWIARHYLESRRQPEPPSRR
jgi:hypothetical protein